MGVFHLSGMGLNPGAVTVPLTYIYILLKAASLGNRDAKNFFATSGEQEQENKGAPECLILFTSSEVITGEKKNDIKMRDDWFKSGREFPKAMWRYFSNLWGELEDDKFRPFYNGEWIKNVYFVEVNVRDFEDCFKKVGTTIHALREKELWINMIGGTNQINIALLLGGSLNAASACYYYIFQSETALLHPEGEKPDLRNPPATFVKNLLDKWYELPVFHLALGPLLNELSARLEQGPMNVKELENMIQKMNFTKQQILPQLRGKLVTIEGDRVSSGPMLERMAKLDKSIYRKNNFSEWKKWAIEKRI